MTMIISPYTGFADGPFQTVLGPIATAADANWANYTVVGKYMPAALAASGSSIRLKLQGPVVAGRTTTINNVYIGLAATSGNAYNFDGGQVAVTFSGSASLTLGTGHVRTSDVITFTIDGSKAVLIAYNLNSTAANRLSYKTGLGGNYTMYRLSGTLQAATTAKNAGYTPTGSASPILSIMDCAP